MQCQPYYGHVQRTYIPTCLTVTLCVEIIGFASVPSVLTVWCSFSVNGTNNLKNTKANTKVRGCHKVGEGVTKWEVGW